VPSPIQQWAKLEGKSRDAQAELERAAQCRFPPKGTVAPRAGSGIAVILYSFRVLAELLLPEWK
jgi:hypothetical protein